MSHPLLSKFLVGLIIFLSATQLGLHFWPESALVYGIRIDYLAPTLYFIDLLIILYFILPSTRMAKAWPQVVMPLTALSPILLVNLLYSLAPLATLSWFFHLFLSLSFVLSLKPLSYYAPTIKLSLTLAVFFQLALATIQVAQGHYQGGLMYYLGERSVAVGSPGIATGLFGNEVVLRAYATFGHPNVLAGWAVIVLLILIQTNQTAIPMVGKQRAVRGSDPPRRSWPTAKMFSRLQNIIRRPGQTLWVLTIFIVILTQSRAAALSLFVIIIPFYLIKQAKLRLLYFLFPILLIPILLSPNSPSRSDTSVAERALLQGVSLKAIQTFPIFGTGAQASIASYPALSETTRLFQPDHNSFTLFLSWFGVFGVSAFVYIFRICFGFRISDFGFMIPLLPLLLFDHYLLTSPQGLFILMLYVFVHRRNTGTILSC